MVDRKKVIAHLDDLRQFADVDVRPVVSPENWDIYSTLCDYIDQIKEEVEMLLKEQEPRVMTLEEAEEAINSNQLGYVEFRYHPDQGWVKCDFTLKNDEVAMLLNGGRMFYQEITDYNCLWRLWTNRPTYKQMRDTPWKE